MSNLIEVSATGDAVTGADGYRLFSVTVSAAAANASVKIKDTSSGSTILTVEAVIGASGSWHAGDPKGVFIGTTIHATLSGAAAVASIEYS